MLEGEISQINLIERLVELWREQFTGAIRFENDGIIKIAYFKGGDILSASTNDRSDSIDEILMRAGKVSREHVKQALAKRKESETLGDALLNLGFITRKELTWARRVQVVGVIRSIAAWTEGSFTIVADYLPKRDEGTLFPLPQVLVELIVTEQDRARFERALDGGNAVFTKTADFDDVWRRLGLNEDADAIAIEIDGLKTATEVATASGRDTFNVYKLLHALSTLGVLTQLAKPKEEPQFSLDDFAGAGVADAADMWNDEATQQGFQLDDVVLPVTPTLEMPKNFSMPEPTPLPAFEEADELSLEPPVAPVSPSWDEQTVVPVTSRREERASEPPPEPQWGFDEAQLETARRAAQSNRSAPSRAPERRTGRYGLPILVLVLAILAAAGYYGFRWWQGREAATTTVAATKPSTPAPVVSTTVAPTATVLEATVATATTTSAPHAMTITPTTTAAAMPMTVTPASTSLTPAPAAPEPQPTQALPRVTARPAAGRERLDAMARQYASSATGNFTVQIQILCDPGNLEKAIREGGEQVWFVPQTIGARSCYRVFWGHFNSRNDAQQALAQIPSNLRDSNSAVKPVPKS
jgi:hypothetical protein